jgi:hypothetical protein
MWGWEGEFPASAKFYKTLGRGPGWAGPWRIALLGFFVRQPAAGSLGLGGIDGIAILIDLDDFAVQIDDKRGAVGDAHLRIEHAIQLGYLTVVIAEQRELRVQLLGPMGKCCDEVRADGQNL